MKILRISATVLVALSFLFGGLSCSKETQDDLPEPIKATNQAKIASTWQEFITRVKSGKSIDPIGQYVDDQTWVEDQNGKRASRVKMDFPERFALINQWPNKRRARYIKNPGSIGVYRVPCEDNPNDPTCIPPPPPVDPTSPSTYFASSEGYGRYTGTDNPNGYIVDLKIAWATNSSPDPSPLKGYTKIYANLNSGAGGAKMYLTYTRSPGEVKYGDYTIREDRVTTGFVRNLQTLEAPCGDCITNFPENTNLLPIQRPGGLINRWNTPDLNDGAGGAYIYGFMTKDPRDGPPVEIGVLISSNRDAQPPVGWKFSDHQDLNKGAGGDFIYFCTKSR